MKSRFAGSVALLRFAAQLDRLKILPFIVLLPLLVGSSILAYEATFSDPFTRQALTLALGTNPAFTLLLGPATDLTTADGFTAWRALAIGDLFAGLMAILIVVRNTRAEEEAGRAELVASAAIGRHARLAAALVLAWLSSLLLGLAAYGVAVAVGGDPVGQFALAATFVVSGFVFAGVAAIAAQLAATAATATAVSVFILAGAYLLRGVAYAAPDFGWAIWLTPLGWAQEVRPVSANVWWPLGACVALAAALAMAAFWLEARRDFGQGLIPAAPGPRGRSWRSGAAGLAFRLQRGLGLAWGFGLIGFGALAGYLSSTLADLLAGNPMMTQILRRIGTGQLSLTFEFQLTLLKVMGLLAAVYGTVVMMRLYGEEQDGRVEPLLATPLTRVRLFLSHAQIAVLGPAVFLLLAAGAIGLVAALAGEEDRSLTLLLQAAAELPAVWLLIGLALAAVGAAPRWRGLAWFGIVWTLVLTLFGPLLNLPDWVLHLDPLRAVPNVTAAAGVPWPLVLVSFGFVVLLAVGLVGYRRRDIPQ